MIRSITIAGLGPHEDTRLDLDAMGHNTLEGASEQGKTLTVDAVCFALFGYDRHGKAIDTRAIRDGADDCSVEILFDWGTVIRRTLSRGKDDTRGKTVRIIDGDEYTTEKPWLGRLNSIGRDPKSVIQVIVPMAWCPLLGNPGDGRLFRNLLADILPKTDKRDIVRQLLVEAGFEWHEGDPINIQDAEMLRRRANRDKDRAHGDVDRLNKLKDAGENTEPVGPTMVEIAAADAIREIADLWEAYADEDEQHVYAMERFAFAEEAAQGWRVDKAALGARPDGDVDAVVDAQKRVEELRKAGHSTAFNLGQHKLKVTVANNVLEKARQHDHVGPQYAARINRAQREHSDAIIAQKAVTDVCPTCERDGWAGAMTAAVERVERAKTESDDAIKESEDRASELNIGRDERVAAAMTVFEEAEAEHAKTVAEQAEHGVQMSKAENTLRVAMLTGGDAIAWDEAIKRLGDCPEVGDRPVKPDPPESVQPDEESIKKAAAVLDQAKEHRGATKQRAKDVASLVQTLAEASIALGLAREEADRLNALVEACRKAPSVAARKELGALGDLGPVEIILGENGGAQVLVDNRPYHMASTGRVVVADAYLRAGLRRALKMPYLPLFVDNTGAVGGMDVPILPPTIHLLTTDEPGIRVTS